MMTYHITASRFRPPRFGQDKVFALLCLCISTLSPLPRVYSQTPEIPDEWRFLETYDQSPAGWEVVSVRSGKATTLMDIATQSPLPTLAYIFTRDTPDLDKALVEFGNVSPFCAPIFVNAEDNADAADVLAWREESKLARPVYTVRLGPPDAELMPQLILLNLAGEVSGHQFGWTGDIRALVRPETMYPARTLLHDTFDDPQLRPEWVRVVPKPGAVISLTATPGSLRLDLPDTETFNSWRDVDEMPAIAIPLTVENFVVRVRMRLIQHGGREFHGGLVLRFKQFDEIIFGTLEGNMLSADRTGDRYNRLPQESDVLDLQVEKMGNHYVFLYRLPPFESWKPFAYKEVSGPPPVSVGFGVKTWEKIRVVAEFEEFLFRELKWKPEPGGGPAAGR